MRHLVIGLGSIGKRHKRLLEEAGETVTGVDKGEPIDWNVDRCFICTPTDTHFGLLRQAVERKIPMIFVEKPMVSTMDEANEVKHWPIHSSRLWIAQNMRFHPGVVAIKENLNKAGKIHYARLWFQHSIKNQRENWEEYMRKTNIVVDCMQWIDLALWLFGPRYKGIPKFPEPIMFNEKFAKLWILHNTGVNSFIDLDFLRQDKSCGIEVIGEKGTLMWFSHWKSPELSFAGFRDFGGVESCEKLSPIGQDYRLDPDVSYKAQLKYLLADQWQSNIDDQIAALEVALG